MSVILALAPTSSFLFLFALAFDSVASASLIADTTSSNESRRKAWASLTPSISSNMLEAACGNSEPWSVDVILSTSAPSNLSPLYVLLATPAS